MVRARWSEGNYELRHLRGRRRRRHGDAERPREAQHALRPDAGRAGRGDEEGARLRRASAPSSSPGPATRSSAPAPTSAASPPTSRWSQKHFASDLFLEFFRLMPRLGKPSLCAANGHVLAGGMGLALSCDLVIAKEGATFGTPEINVGAFPYMIMAIIYRNVPRKKVNEMMLLGERLSAEQAVEYGLANKVVPAAEFDAAVAEWAGKLASKSPVLMRLGHDAMYRQQDMAVDDALEFLRSQLSLTFSTEDIVEGVTAFFEKREPAVEGALIVAESRPRSRSPRAPAARHGDAGRADRAAARAPRQGEARRRRGEDRQAARTRQADRPRADRRCWSTRAPSSSSASTAGRTSPSGRWTASRRPADGVITGWGDVDGRPCCIAAYDFTVMAGSMGMTGELKVTPPARDGALEADAVHLAARLGRRPHPGGDRLALRRLRPPLPRGGRNVGRDPDGGGDDGALRRRHRLHPGALGLRADGLRPGRDGAGRPAPDQSRDRRGHLDGGARRRQGPLPQIGSGGPRGRRTTRSASPRSRPTSPTSPRTARRSRRCARPPTSTSGCRRS